LAIALLTRLHNPKINTTAPRIYSIIRGNSMIPGARDSSHSLGMTNDAAISTEGRNLGGVPR